MVFTVQAERSLRPTEFLMQHSSPQNTLRILVVDDDKVDRLSLRRTLKASPYEATLVEATDAEAALRVLDESAFDCIFVDYNLPGKNGLELTRIIRERGIQTPVIALTGQGNEQTAVDIMKAGASDYLTKSRLSADVVSLAIRGALRVHQAEMVAVRANLNLREKNLLLEQQNQELEKQRRHIHLQNLQLQEVSRLKSEFLATMSHELRTPLNAIIGFSQILLSGSKGSLNEAQRKMADRVLANGENLLTLINDILDFSKIEAGRLGLDPADLDVVALVSRTVDELNSLASQKNLSVQTVFELEDPMVVNDAVRVRQILVNLLSNALKFTERGSVQVRVEAISEAASERSEENGSGAAAAGAESIVITVKDTGCGIDQAALAYIFDPFHQADQRLTRQHGGTGLGLAIVSSLVSMMNGSVAVDSELQKGTTISVSIPRRVVAA
ncbi:MAG: ATP-binding protein [Phormidesmis sp.]